MGNGGGIQGPGVVAFERDWSTWIGSSSTKGVRGFDKSFACVRTVPENPVFVLFRIIWLHRECSNNGHEYRSGVQFCCWSAHRSHVRLVHNVLVATLSKEYGKELYHSNTKIWRRWIKAGTLYGNVLPTLYNINTLYVTVITQPPRGSVKERATTLLRHSK